MKKSSWLIIPFFLLFSTISFAQNQDSPSTNLLKKDASKAQYDCSVTQKSFEQYINLIGLSKENILNTFSEKPYFIENGGLQYFHAGAIIYFKDNGNGPAKKVFIERNTINFNGAKVGDKVENFRNLFKDVIREDKLEGYYNFNYKGKVISVLYDPTNQEVLSVYISDGDIHSPKNEQESNITKFENEIGGVYFGNLKYELSAPLQDTKLEEAINKVYNLQTSVDKKNYFYNRIDLDGDNNMETFVYLNGATFSGTGGGSGLLFKYNNGEYNLISRFTLVRSPIIISENTTNGWKDIIMYVSGGGDQSFFAEMKFDGTSYPLNPSMQPKLESGRVILGTAIIADL